MKSPLDNPFIMKKLTYHSRLKRLLDYLQDHVAEPMNLDKAACLACMERTAFSKFFSRVVGMTYRDFIQQWRIAISIQRMAISDCSLTELALAVGFSNVDSFARTFRKITGLPPSEYRKHLLVCTDVELGQELTDNGQNPSINNQEKSRAIGNR